MLGSLIAPFVQYGALALLGMAAVWFIGRSAVNKHKRRQAEKNDKIRKKQLEAANDAPRNRDELVDRLRGRGL